MSSAAAGYLRRTALSVRRSGRRREAQPASQGMRRPWILVGAGWLVTAAAGAVAAARPTALLIFLAVPIIMLLTRPAGRLVVILLGAVVVFQSSSAVNTPKLVYLGTVILCGAISGVRIHSIRTAQWASPFRMLFTGAIVYLGYLLLTAVIAVSYGTGISSWARDIIAYALLAIGPLIAVDAAASLSARASRRLVVVLGVVIPFGFTSDWLARRGETALPVDRFILASFALSVVPFSYALVRCSVGPHRLRWLLLAIWVPAILLLSGTRTNVVLLFGLLGLLGTRRKVRLTPARMAGLAVAVTALIAGALAVLARFTGQSQFLSARIGLATRFIGSGNDQSAVLRERAYTVALQAFQGHPLLGTGPGHLFPGPVTGAVGGLSLDTPLLVPAKFGLLGTTVLLLFLGTFAVAFRRARKLAGWSVVTTTGRVTAFILLALTPFGPAVEDKGFALGMMMLLLLLATELRDSDGLSGAPTAGTGPPPVGSRPWPGKTAILRPYPRLPPKAARP